jgi:hypothetical protein
VGGGWGPLARRSRTGRPGAAAAVYDGSGGRVTAADAGHDSAGGDDKAPRAGRRDGRSEWTEALTGGQAESLPIAAAAAAADALTNEAGVRNYMKAVVRFREKLAVLVHITGGQPTRSPELLSIRHTNTAGGRHRNVFIEDGYVAMATRYHKGHSSTQMPRIIHRYVPREVGELVVWTCVLDSSDSLVHVSFEIMWGYVSVTQLVLRTKPRPTIRS